MTSEELAMWKEYELNRNVVNRNKIFDKYFELARIIAKTAWNTFEGCVEYDELIQDAGLGLINAIERFDYIKGIKFETYASLRIRGTIIDRQRELDFFPRGLRKKNKENGISTEGIISIEKLFDLVSNDSIESNIENREFNKFLEKIIMKCLTKREIQVLKLYFYENIKLIKIAKLMRVHDSRISQIKAMAIRKIKLELRKTNYYFNEKKL